MRLERARDDDLVIGEVALDELRNQFRILGVEDDLPAPVGHGHHQGLLAVGGDAGQLAERARRDDDGDGARGGVLDGRFAHRDAEAVGGGQRNFVAVDRDHHALQHRAGFLGRGGKSHLLNHLAEVGDFKFDSVGEVGHRHGRKFVGVDAFDVGVAAAGAHIERLRARVERQLHLLGRQRADQIDEGARRHGDRALLCVLRRDPAGDAEFEVGGREAQPVFTIGGDQDVGQHGQRAARGNGARNHA